MQSIGVFAEKVQDSVRVARPAPIAAAAPNARTRIERAKLNQLDATHPGVKRAIAAAYTWRDRYVHSQVTRDELPARAPSLILSGPNGVGKTHIARSIYWAVLKYPLDENGERVQSAAFPAGCWMEAPDLIMRLAPTQGEYGNVELLSPASMVSSSPLVVIDDLGGEGTLPFIKGEQQEFERQARWFRFIDYCYASDVPVIITTNLGLQNGALAAWVGPRVWDRLNEMAPVGQMVSMWDVPSWRVKAGGR